MNKVRQKFLLSAMLSVFVLLTVLLTVINGVNFTMAANDADEITRMLAEGSGRFGGSFAEVPGEMPSAPDDAVQPPEENGEELPAGETPGVETDPRANRGAYDRMGPMGPNSPETRASVRYFTFRFDESGNAQTVAMQISAFTEEEAQSIAKSLLNRQVGWAKFTYRYRVYRSGGYTYVTVIDQGRELLPSYRILLISVIGEIVGLLVSFLFLRFTGKRLFQPLEEADRKQQRFLADAEREFKIPLTVLDADVELLERRSGPDDTTVSAHRQVKKLSALVRKLGTLTVFVDQSPQERDCDLSGILTEATDRAAATFAERGISLRVEAEEGIAVKGDPDLLPRAVGELVENAARFSLTYASFLLKREGERIVLIAENDASLRESGNLEQIFDRFTVLENAKSEPGGGLGLSFVRDVIRSMSGRMQARAEGGVFTLRITL